MNNVATTNGGAVASAGQGNFFTSYGEQASQKGAIVGALLKFSKGDYTIGDNNEDVPVGTQLIANMGQLLAGWIRWENSKPSEQIMGAVIEGYQPPKRNTLGDDNEANWERDEQTGKPRDPWQFSNYLVLRELDKPGEEGLLTFATSSRGGLNAIGELCKAYGKTMSMKPNDWPIIQLKVDSYMHPNKAYGRIKIPVFDIVGWAPKTSFDGVGEPSAGVGVTAASQQLHVGEPAYDDSGRRPRGAESAAPASATKF